MPVYEIETDQGVFEIDADREPTQQEALAAIGGPPPSPRASPASQQEAFEQQFIAERTQDPLQQALSALVAPSKAGIGLAKGIGELALKGIQGVGSIYGKAAGQQSLSDLLKSYYGDVTQTVGEIGPRAAYELAQAGVQGFQSPETAARTLRSIGAVANPLQEALRSLVSPQAAPTQSEASQAFEEELFNQALQQQGERGIAEFAQQQAGLVPAGTAQIDVARATPLLLGAEALPGAISRTAAAITPTLQRVITAAPRAVARVTPTAETAAMSALNLAKEEVQSILPSAVPNITKAAGKALPNAEEIIQAAPVARKSLFDEAIGGLTKSKEQGLVAKGNSMVDDAIDAIQSDSRYMLDKPDEAAALMSKYEKYRRDLDPLEAQKLLEDTNSGLSSHWDKSSKGQKLDLTDAELRAERAVAANLSRQVDDLYQIGSKTFNDPYRQIGKIIELEKNLKLTKAGAEKAFAERVSPSRRTGGTIPLGKGEVARKAGRGVTSVFRNTELELLDKNLKGAFKGAPKPLASIPVPDESIPGLSRNYLPGETPPPLPVVEAPVAPSFSESTLRALREFGVTTDSPYWQSIGEQLEASTGPARSRALLSETINR